MKREIGFDFDNQIIHAYPSKKYPYGKYGIFDLNTFDVVTQEDFPLQEKEFEEKWMDFTKIAQKNTQRN